MSYLTELDVSLNEAEEQKLQAKGFSKLSLDLNTGTRGKPIYLWYKKQSGVAPITRVQVAFNSDMDDGLAKAGYTQITKNLNAGTGGDPLHMWYLKGTTEYDTPIVEIDVTENAEAEAHKFKLNWERVACDLNRNAGGSWLHAWVKRAQQTYICNVIATDTYSSDADYFQEGYTRMDEDTNRWAGGAFVFIWYRQTTDLHRGLTKIDISTNDTEYQQLQQRKFKPVPVNLNEGTGGNKVYLWYRKGAGEDPIKTMTLLLKIAAEKVYEKAGVTVIERNLNSGNKGLPEYLCVYE